MEKPKSAFRLKWENYWYHYKALTFFCIFVAIAGIWLIKDVFFKAKPDLQISISAVRPMTYDQVWALEELLASLIEDENGDGKTVAAVVNIQFPDMAHPENITDPELLMAAQVRIAGEFSSQNNMLFIFDSAIFDYTVQEDLDIFADLSSRYPELELEDPRQIPLNLLPKLTGDKLLAPLGENLFICMRNYDILTGRDRERAEKAALWQYKLLDRLIAGE